MPRRQVPGTVYLIQFDRPYRHAGHYLGWSENLPARLAQHRSGRGVLLMDVVAAAGIGWTVVHTWEGTRSLERRLKARGGHARICPVCRAAARAAVALEEVA